MNIAAKNPAATDARARSGDSFVGGQTDRLYSVTELGHELGVTPRTLRFYEDQGLITPRRAGNNRIYTYRDRARMILILRGKRLGFSLREIKEYLDLYDADRTQREQLRLLLSRVADRRRQLEEQRVALDEALAELDAIEQEALDAVAAADQRDRMAG